MKWGKEVMVARTSPEVYRRVRASPKCGKTSESPDAARMRREWAEGKRKGKGNEREQRDISKSPWDEGKEKGTRRKGEGQGE